MDSDALLVLATLDNLDPYLLAPVISNAAARARKRLTILLFSPYFNVSDGGSRTQLWDKVQELLTIVYVQATSVAQEMGKVLLDVEILLKGIDDDVPDEFWTGFDRVEGGEQPSTLVKLPPSLSHPIARLPGGERLPSHDELKDIQPTDQGTKPSRYPVVVLGGTFDHLHAGHKILLSMGAWITSQKLIVGVTDDELLRSKAFAEVLEPLPVRMEKVRAFLTRFDPALVYDIVPISDVYGPTGWDPNIQALVVSKETLPGAASIASHRKSHSLPPLETFVIDVISSTSSKLDHNDAELLKTAKMSSTFIREWIVRNMSG